MMALGLSRRGGLGLAAAVVAGLLVSQAALANGQRSYNWPGAPFPGVFPGGFGMSGVTMNVSQQGGVSVNIANIGAAGSFFGWPGFGRHGAMIGTDLSGLPGFVGGHVLGGNGMNGLNVVVGGGMVAPGGVSVNIANVALNNTFYAGYPWAGPRPPYRPRPTQSFQPDSVGGSSGNNDSGGGGGGDGGGGY